MRETPVFKNFLHVWESRIQEITKRTDKPQFPFGLEALDNLTNGIPKGKVTVIAGRTSEAKTSFALQSAFTQSDLGKTILYISLEDDDGQISERVFCNLRQIDNQDLLKGKVNVEIINDPVIKKIFEKVKLAVIDNFGYKLDEIKFLIDQMQIKPDLVYLDYIQMLDQEDGESEYEALSKFSRLCKKFAKENDIVLVIVSQINRQGAKEGRPQAHHLQGCGKLEQVCDLLLVLYCPFIYKDTSFDFEEREKIVIHGYKECPPDYVEVMVLKNKNGMRNVIAPMQFIGKYYQFVEWKNRVDTRKPLEHTSNYENKII